MKVMLEPGEILILSYGMGIYRLTSVNEIDINNEALRSLDIVDLLKVDDSHYIGLSSTGKLPSSMEINIQCTEEFKVDERYAIKHGSRSMKDRFFHLHRVSVVG